MHESEKWKKSLSRVRLLATPWTAAYQAPLSMGFSRQEYWNGVPLPSLSLLSGSSNSSTSPLSVPTISWLLFQETQLWLYLAEFAWLSSFCDGSLPYFLHGSKKSCWFSICVFFFLVVYGWKWWLPSTSHFRAEPESHLPLFFLFLSCCFQFFLFIIDFLQCECLC